MKVLYLLRKRILQVSVLAILTISLIISGCSSDSSTPTDSASPTPVDSPTSAESCSPTLIDTSSLIPYDPCADTRPGPSREIKPEQLEEMSDIGPIGVLANGSDGETIHLPEGITIPKTKGKQPLIYEPLPPLPMPDHPYLLDEYASGGVHSDSYNSSTSPLPGPHGINPIATTTAVLDDNVAMATPLLRDHEGRLVSVCISLVNESKLVLFDPSDDFSILASTDIPKRAMLLDPAGAWYTRMDHLGRPIVPTPEQEIIVYEIVEEGGVYSWNIAESWNLSDVLPERVSVMDVIPDFHNNYWLLTGYAQVGYLNRSTGNTEMIELGCDGNEVSPCALTVGPEGAYVMTTHALYMMDVDADGKPYVRWRWAYPTSDNVDLSAPTLIDNGNLIAIALNGIGDQSRLTVLRATATPMTDEDRLVCQMPMFKPGKSHIKNTMMGYGRSIVAENNFGGDFFEVGAFEPGLARVDVREDYCGCDLIWEEYTISSQVPPRLSIGDGHIYLYSHTRDQSPDVHAYYLTAINFETGEVDSEIFVASGKRMDNPMLSLDFWPGGVMVGGVRNGIITLRDGTE